MPAPLASISIVCVYNNLGVRQQCLDRSIRELGGEAADVEYLPVDNVDGSYPSAGAALNHGASLARGDVVVFAHQDVFLHSLGALKAAAGQLSDGGFGMLGAVGVGPDGRVTGRVRDRVVLLGDPVAHPREVESVDEVLFLVPRSHLLRDPLTESRDLAWHAYAVEYGLRVRRRGQRVGVADLPLTHNSLTINLDRLDQAHRAIAERYADLLPVRTTCGVVTRMTAKRARPVLFPAHRWRYPWLRESLAVRKAVRAARAAGPQAVVLADIRRDVDDVISRSPGRSLRIVNRSASHRVMCGSSPLELARREGRVLIEERDIAEIPAVLESRPTGSWLLLTNLSRVDLEAVSSPLAAAPGILGFHEGIGFWALVGASGADVPPRWGSSRATPLGWRPHAATREIRP